MKKLFATAMSCLLLGTVQAPAAGWDCCDPCACSDWQFSVNADYLYWEVCDNDLDYTDGLSPETIRYLNPGYSSNYRLDVRMDNGSAWDVGARYTHFSKSQSESLEIIALQGSLEYTFNYDVVDIELGYNLAFDCNAFPLRPFVGAKLAWIEQNFDETVLGSSDNHQKVDAYGLYTGLEGRYELCQWDVCCSQMNMAFVARGSAGILRSSTTSKAFENDAVVVERLGECAYLGTLEAFVGLDFGYEYSDCFDPHLMIGYETNYLIGLRDIDSSVDRKNIALGGLVVRLGVGF